MAATPLTICLLGGFRLVKQGRLIPLRAGSKTEVLLSYLALAPGQRLARERVLATLWPRSEAALAAQSLNTLVYSLHRLVGGVLSGASPVVNFAGDYRLNQEAGVAVDVAIFDAAADAGERQARAGDHDAAWRSYGEAVRLYSGDLHVGSEVAHLIERERLRARYLGLRARLADGCFLVGDLGGALAEAQQILLWDACREDAHRMAMSCYLGLGQRTQALRQYQLCRLALAAEFDAEPEPATDELYELIRSHPDRALHAALSAVAAD